MSDSLPSEVITEILSRLSVKSLIRFRCVSKTWDSLISSPNFIATHLSRALSNPQYPSDLVVIHRFDYRLKKHRSPAIRIHLLSLDPKIEKRSLLAGPLDSIRDQSDFIGSRSFVDHMDVIGSANGLFCLRKGSEYVLCNPSIQKAISLPHPNISRLGFECVGFGYDRKTDDYKLVRLVDVGGTAHYLADIYTLRTGAWRSLTATAHPYLTVFHYISPLDNVFFNGAVHWRARTLENQSPFRRFIVSFDMEDEVFREMAVPNSFQDAYSSGFDIAVVDGFLAVIPPGDDYDVPVWVMKEYGRAESWTKQFEINFSYGEWDPMSFRQNGEVLVVHEEHLFSYERNSERTWCLHVYGIRQTHYFDTYVESLALLNVADGILGVKVSSFCVSKLKEKEKKKKKEDTDVGTNVRDQLRASRKRMDSQDQENRSFMNLLQRDANMDNSFLGESQQASMSVDYSQPQVVMTHTKKAQRGTNFSMGRKVEKEKGKRKEGPSEDVVEYMKKKAESLEDVRYQVEELIRLEKEKLHLEKMDREEKMDIKRKKLHLQELDREEKMDIARKMLHLQELDREERIMMIDTSMMSEVQQQYWKARQNEIIGSQQSRK